MGGGGNNTTTTVRELSPEQRELLGLVIPIAEEFVANPPQLYPGSTIAPFDPLQELGQNLAVGTALGTILPTAQTTAQANQFVQSSLLPVGAYGLGQLVGGIGPSQAAGSFLLSGQTLSPETNPVFEQQVEAAIRPIQKQLTQEILPQIRGEAVQAGQFGGSRQGIAEGLAIQGFEQKAGDIATEIAARNYEQGLNAMTRALDTVLGAGTIGVRTGLGEGVRSLFATPRLADFLLRPASVVEAIGAQRRAMEQALLQEEAQRYVTEQMIPFLVAQDVANLAFGIPAGKTISQSPVPEPSPLQIIMGILGPLAILGGLI